MNTTNNFIDKNNQPKLKECWKSTLDLGNRHHMVRDTKRNRFYDNILKETVAGKHCLDVGFGTGLLSYLALKYNPKHITAYELDVPTFEFSKWVLKKLNLENKITLLNEKCTLSKISKEYDLMYHELLGPEMWDECNMISLFNTSVPVVPSTYLCDFYITELDQDQFDQNINYKKNQNFESWYNTVKAEQWPNISEYNQFYTLPQWIQDELINDFDFNNVNFENTLNVDIDFGVEFTVDYPGEMNKFFQSSLKDSTQIYPLHSSPDSPLHGRPGAPFIQDHNMYYPHKNKNSKKIASIAVNQNNKTITIENPVGSYQSYDIDFSKPWVTLCIDNSLIKNKIICIQPVFTLIHNSHSLVIQDGHWGASMQGKIVKNIENMTIYQNLESARILYGQST